MRRALALITITVVAAAGLTVASPAGAGAAPSRINWQPCPDVPEVDCASLTVPVDWSRPHGPTLNIALARRKATDPARRIGSVLVNPGGPGGAGVELVKQTPFLSPNVASRFDIVGFDPRGVGESSPIMCDLDIAIEPYPISPKSQAELNQLIDHNRRYGESCRALSGPVFDFVDSVSVARDIDAIRAALGEAKLNYYGVSYGTLLGQMYAELFPGRVRTLALDSNMDHSLFTAFQFLRTETVAYQESFDEFVKWSDRTPDSPLHGRDVRQVFADLLAKAERGELAFPDGTPVSALDLHFITFGSFYGPSWRGLAELYVVLEGGAPMESAAKRVAGEAIHDPFQAVFCQDWRLPVHNFFELDVYRRVLAATVAPDVKLSPLGELATLSCLGWPSRVNNPQHVLRVKTSKPILMINSRFDPATPYQWATNAARQSNAVLLNYDGWGHGAYFSGSTCVVEAVDHYLFTGQTPPRGTHCAAVEPPFGAVAAQTIPGKPTTRWTTR